MKRLPTWVEVDLDRLDDNLRIISDVIGDGVRILLTVKADAYGHGAVQVSQAASERVALLGVATLDEATELSDAGITVPLLILSPILDTEIPMVADMGLRITISSFGIAEQVSQYAVKNNCVVGVHVEIDTGMGRTGVAEEFGVEEVARIGNLPGVRLDGVYTHFPSSDNDATYTQHQIERFLALITQLRADGVDVGLVHSANSAAVAGMSSSHMDVVRPGLLAYGLHPTAGQDTDVTPILTWKSRLVRVRRFPRGRTISYGRTFVTERDSVIGVVPVGYGHGYPFRASAGGHMLVGGKQVPIVGRVTMDMTMVDLTDLERTPERGAEVVLVGRQDDAVISFHDVARWSGTLCYEVMCGISKRVPRTYFRKGKVETFKSLLGVLPNHITL